jgi:hypothetical protein
VALFPENAVLVDIHSAFVRQFAETFTGNCLLQSTKLTHSSSESRDNAGGCLHLERQRVIPGTGRRDNLMSQQMHLDGG